MDFAASLWEQDGAQLGKLISVCSLKGDSLDRTAIWALAAVWKEMGLDVCFDTSYRDGADLCVLHHNLTRLDPRELPAPPGGAYVINGRATDISKGRYSTLRLLKGEAWNGRVIIKTQANYFGLPEFRSTGRRNSLDSLNRLHQHFTGRAQEKERWQYFFANDVSAVPDWVWDDDNLIVERFMPERIGEMYCIRGWMFLGSKGYGYKVWSDKPLVKTWTMVGYEIIEHVPDALHRYREELGLDYGKFDYVELDGQVHLIDANKTPSYAGEPKSPRLRMLAEGILDFLT